MKPSKDSFANGIGRLIPDSRNQAFVRHSYEEMASQRVDRILCGYEDANDCGRLRKDSAPTDSLIRHIMLSTVFVVEKKMSIHKLLAIPPAH